VRISNVDKKSAEDQGPVRLCNYTDVYYRDTIHPDQEFMTATATAEQIEAFGLLPGDVIITKDSETPDDIGVPAFVAESAADLVCGYHLAVIRPAADQIEGRYLYWAMKSKPVRSQLSSAATGITRFGLRADAIKGLRIPLPPLCEQRRIANFLDQEVSRLEALRRAHRDAALLARRRIEGAILKRAVPASDGWAPGHPVDLLPLTTSNKGWKPIRLKFTVEEVTNGVWGAEPTGGADDARCVRVADFDYSQGRVTAAPTLRSVPTQLREQKALRPGDLLLEKSGGGEQQPVGRVVLWDLSLEEPVVCSNFIARMRPRPGFDGGFLQLLHRALYFAGVTSLSIKQTTGIQNLDSSHYLGQTVSIPELQEQARIQGDLRVLVEAERCLARKTARQAELLDEHRDAVISTAILGAIDFSLPQRPAVAA
jgi:type I restriction enzyme, S subunit